MFPEVLDSSMLADFKACPTKFKYTYVDNWKARQKSTHLHAGGAFAKGLEVTRRAYYEQLLPNYFQGPPDENGIKPKPVQKGWLPWDARRGQLSKDLCISLGAEALLREYGDHQPSDFGSAANKSALRMAGGLEFYFHNYPLSHDTAYPILMPGGKRGIEFSFVQPLPINHPDTGQPLQFSGRADGIFGFAGGTYIFDDKTASQLGPTWAKQWKLRAQFSSYCWAARESGIKVDGVVVRGISFLKNGYGAAEDISFRSDYMIKQWYTEALDWIEQMITCYKNNRWAHNFDHACSDFGGCQFEGICDMQDDGPWLRQGFEKRHWDPVTRIETKLLEDK